MNNRRRYGTDLSDAAWALAAPMLPLYAANALADRAAPRTASGLLPASPWALPAVVAAQRTVGPRGGSAAEGTVMVPESAAGPRGALRVVVVDGGA